MRKQFNRFISKSQSTVVRGAHRVGSALKPTPKPSMFMAGVKFGLGFTLVSMLMGLALYGLFGYIFMAVLS